MLDADFSCRYRQNKSFSECFSHNFLPIPANLGHFFAITLDYSCRCLRVPRPHPWLSGGNGALMPREEGRQVNRRALRVWRWRLCRWVSARLRLSLWSRPSLGDRQSTDATNNSEHLLPLPFAIPFPRWHTPLPLRSASNSRKTSATAIRAYHENNESLRAHPSITIGSLSKERQIKNFCNYLIIKGQREKNTLKSRGDFGCYLG